MYPRHVHVALGVLCVYFRYSGVPFTSHILDTMIYFSDMLGEFVNKFET